MAFRVDYKCIWCKEFVDSVPVKVKILFTTKDELTCPKCGVKQWRNNETGHWVKGWPGTYWLEKMKPCVDSLKEDKSKLELFYLESKIQYENATRLRGKNIDIDGLDTFLQQVIGKHRAIVWIINQI